MADFKKTQLLTLILIATLLFLTPLLSSSLRSTYLYLIINLLIISLGVEAGFLSSSPSTREPETDMKSPNSNNTTITPIQIMITNARVEHLDVLEATKHQEKAKIQEKLVLEDTLKVKKCSSTPSIFFIESKVEEEVEELEEERDEKEEEELFVKAEVFIGNFYKQLRMQREDSWNRIHKFYQNGFN